MVMSSVGRFQVALKAALREARAARQAGMLSVETSGGVGRLFKNCVSQALYDVYRIAYRVKLRIKLGKLFAPVARHCCCGYCGWWWWWWCWG